MADPVISETDADDGTPQGGPPVTDLPSPLRPQSSGPIRTGANAPPKPDEEFEIIEVDNEGKEIGPPQPVTPPAQKPVAPLAKGGDLPADSELEFVQRPEFDAEGQPTTRSRSKRQIRKEGRERTFAENAALKAELARRDERIAQLEDHVGAIAPRVVELGENEVRNRVSTLKAELATVESRADEADGAYFDAVQAGDRAAATKALRERDNLALRRFQLTGAVGRIEEALAQRSRDANLSADGRQAAPRQDQRQQQQRQAPEPVLTTQAAQLRADFIQNDAPWLLQPGNEEDARVLAAIDDDVAAKGYDPSTNDYWDELAARAAKYLPDRFTAVPAVGAPSPARRPAPAAQPAPIRRGPPTAAPAGQTPPAKNQVRIDPNRKEALIQAGVLASDGTVLDAKKFNRQVKAFAEYDRANGAGR